MKEENIKEMGNLIRQRNNIKYSIDKITNEYMKDIDKTDTSIKDESESHVLRIEINSRCGSIPIYGLSSKDKCAILKSIKSKLSSNLDNTDTEIDNLTKDK